MRVATGQARALKVEQKMATLPISIVELQHEISHVHADAERVAESSFWLRVRQKNNLGNQLVHLAASQDRWIATGTEQDFSKYQPEDLARMAPKVDDMVKILRELLRLTSTLDPLTRFAWRRPLRKLAQQVDHIESIAESLHLACDPEATQLLALAAGRIAKK